MIDRRTKFIRQSENGKKWEYGYTQTEVKFKDRQVIDEIVGYAATLQAATAAWLDQKQPGAS